MVDDQAQAQAQAGNDNNSDHEPAVKVDLEPYLDRAQRAKMGAAGPQVAPCSVHFTFGAKFNEPRAMLILESEFSPRTQVQLAHSVDSFLTGNGWWREALPYPVFLWNCFAGLPLEDPSTRLQTSVGVCYSWDGEPCSEWTLETCYNPLYNQCPRPRKSV